MTTVFRPALLRSVQALSRTSSPLASSSTKQLLRPTSRPVLSACRSGRIDTERLVISSRRWNSSSVSPESARIEAPEEGKVARPQKIAQIEPRLQMTFTCTADGCGHRSTHEFSKRAYTKGLVLVQCPECKNRHLIADHIGWFKESLEGGKLKTVEDLLAAKGEKIRKGRVNFDGDIEYEGDD
ncbi:hypothetical protein IAR55_003527 [Kwoniella newhampshirensis]|uniref:DNL-type domain-containing protein n=1 Tax=Kwoniella newhampshirensis TaxID=1651941 RepID=A0AAW0YX29_9TREE